MKCTIYITLSFSFFTFFLMCPNFSIPCVQILVLAFILKFQKVIEWWRLERYLCKDVNIFTINRYSVVNEVISFLFKSFEFEFWIWTFFGRERWWSPIWRKFDLVSLKCEYLLSNGKLKENMYIYIHLKFQNEFLKWKVIFVNVF